MKTTFDIIDKVFKIVNVTSVKTTIDGKVYRFARPLDSVLRDIVIFALPIAGGTYKDLQDCTVIINCFAKDLAPGRADESHIDTTTVAVLALLEAYNSTTSPYLHLEINSQAMMEDMDQAGIHYSSIRVNCTIQYLTT